MIMPLLTQVVIDVYGWRRALLLVGGLNIHLILCGALLKATPTPASKISNDSESRGSAGIPQTGRETISWVFWICSKV